MLSGSLGAERVCPCPMPTATEYTVPCGRASRLPSQRGLDRSFGYGAALHILMKDIDLAIAQGEELGVPMWVCQAARLVYKHAMFEGASDDDISTLIRHVERGAGFELPRVS